MTNKEKLKMCEALYSKIEWPCKFSKQSFEIIVILFNTT